MIVFVKFLLPSASGVMSQPLVAMREARAAEFTQVLLYLEMYRFVVSLVSVSHSVSTS